MNFNNMNDNVLSRSVRLALMAGLAAGGFSAQSAVAQDDAAELDRIEVTGTRIKRVDVEGPNPITVIDREDLEVTGDISVADVLRQSTFNSFGSFRESSGNTAQSQSTANLRGVGSDRTLILLDGRRMPSSPVLGGSTQNLNAIPFAAVERIEILRDGASAVYGSDAIGGVINIVLRKDFEGLKLIAQAERPTRGEPDANNGSITGGVTGGRGNITFVVDHQERDIFFNADRANGRAGLDPGVGLSVFGYPPSAYVYDEVTGDFLGTFADPRCPTALGSDPLFPNSVLSQGAYGDLCLFNYAATSANEASLRRDSMMVNGNLEINDNTSAFVRLTAFNSRSFGRYAATPFTQPFPTMAASNPNNPFGGDALLLFRFVPGGTRDSDVRDHMFDVLFGFQGSLDIFGGAEWELGMQHSRYEVDSIGTGYAISPLIQPLFDSGAFNPFGDPRDPSAQAAVGEVRHTTLRNSEYRMAGIDGSIGFDMFELPAGAVQVAFGFEYLDEFFKDFVDAQSAAGNVVGTAGGNASGERARGAIFGEALFPILDNLNVALAVRHDRYNDFGNDTNPKLSVEFRPMDTLLLRGSWGTGFRAPSLADLYQSPQQSFNNAIDRQACAGQIPGFSAPFDPCVSRQYEQAIGGNPNLGAEESTNWGLGAVWSPIDDLTLSLDYYDIELEGQINSVTLQTLLNQAAAGNQNAINAITRNPNTGAITFVRNGPLNLAGFKTNGIDFEVDYQFDTGIGRFNPFLQVSYVMDFDQAILPGDPFWSVFNPDPTVENSAGATVPNPFDSAFVPDQRANLGVTWSHGDFGATLIANYIGDSSQFTDGALQHYPSWTTLDAQVTWSTPWKGKVTLGVRNAGDREPPLDNTILAHPFYDNSQYDFYGRVPYVRYEQDL